MTHPDQSLEEACPSCGVMVRRGLVRCWNCGSFMRADVAAAYERMQKRQQDVSFQPLPEDSPAAGNRGAGGKTAGQMRNPPPPPSNDTPDGGDADFDFGGSFLDDPNEDFELGAEFKPTSPEAARGGAGGGTSGGRGGNAAPQKPTAPESPVGKTEPATVQEPNSAISSGESTGKDAASGIAKPPAARSPETDEAHSVATGGEALLQVALQEETEVGRRGRKMTGFNPVRVSDGWFITCPCPARVRIKVKEQHCGKTGKCPNPSCGSYFTVPTDLPRDEPVDAAAAMEPESTLPADPADKAGPYTHWLRDVRLHVLKPAKARRKPGGHEKDFKPADLGFSRSAGLIALALVAKPAGFSLSKKKPEQIRDELIAELRAGKPPAELSTETQFAFEPPLLARTAVEYPPAYEHESTFAGVPVFGEGRIAVKLPAAGAADEMQFVSMTLSQFRRLRELLVGLFEQQQLGLGCPIPTADDTVTVVCHYSEDPFTVIRQPAFYLTDPELPLDIVGYRCETCGLIVSENSRKKEKIGGLDGKALAKAKCPKCKGKFGQAPLYALKPKADETPPAA